MTSAFRCLSALGILGIGLLSAGPTWAHSWYPKDCCHDRDCAPVESMVQFVPTGGSAPQLLVTSKHGRVLIPRDFPVRESRDSRMHVCMRHNEFGKLEVMCLFMPPMM
jgi:hypothetical protein